MSQGGNGGNNSGQGDKWDREAIHEPVDWMTYSHDELYKMVHTGVNLESANAAATNWNKIGEEIAGVRENLIKAVEKSTVGWEGESARLARDGLTEVTNWVNDTATYAQKVSSAITTETSNVEAARAAMPPPPKPLEPPVPTPASVPAPVRPALINRLREPAFNESVEMVDVDSYTIQQRQELATVRPGLFAGFDTVGVSAVESLAANDASHRLAADVMAAFQRNSAAVDQTVPSQFAPPVNPVNPVLTDASGGGRTPTTPDGGTAGGGAAGPVPTGTPQNRGTTNASRGGGYGGGAYGGGGGSGSGRAGFTGGMNFGRIPAANQGQQGGGGGAGGGSASGGSAGVSNEGRAGAGAAAAAASGAPGGQTRAFQNPLAMGGAAPMAGAPAAGGQNNDEREHKSASYLEEDDNVFGLDRKAAPPVIGQ